MRYRRRRNPRHLTADEKAAYHRWDADLARARVLELGVAAMIDGENGTPEAVETEQASHALLEAAVLRRAAEEAQRELLRVADLREDDAGDVQ